MTDFQGWKPQAKALYDEMTADRDRWRREFDMERAKVRRAEYERDQARAEAARMRRTAVRHAQAAADAHQAPGSVLSNIEHCADCERLKRTLDMAHLDWRAEATILRDARERLMRERDEARQQLRGAVEAERHRNASLVRALAGNSWEPSIEAALYEAARQITASGGQSGG